MHGIFSISMIFNRIRLCSRSNELLKFTSCLFCTALIHLATLFFIYIRFRIEQIHSIEESLSFFFSLQSHSSALQISLFAFFCSFGTFISFLSSHLFLSQSRSSSSICFVAAKNLEHINLAEQFCYRKQLEAFVNTLRRKREIEVSVCLWVNYIVELGQAPIYYFLSLMHKGRRKRENLRVLKLASNLTWLLGCLGRFARQPKYSRR